MSEEKKCSGNCESCASKGKENCALEACLGRIRHKIVVMSGKGGVGKSTVAANLACALALSGYRVGLLDADVHGPSIPGMLHLENLQLEASGSGRILPPETAGIKVMSIGFLLEHADDPVVWRGPMKIGVLQQLFTEVEWGELDYMVIDCPPGTGDEPLTICQMVKDSGSAVIVTTPQKIASSDVSKSVNFCRQMQFPVTGLIENMSSFVCPKCGEITEIFSSGGGEKLAASYGIAFLGKLPIDPEVCRGGDEGKPFAYHRANTPVGKAFAAAVEKIEQVLA